MENTMGIQPTYDMARDNEFGMGGGWFWIIIILLFGMWNNNGNNYDDRFLERDIFNTNQNVSNTACNTQRDVLDNRYELGTNVLENRYQNALQTNTLQAQIQNCCCEIKTTMHEEGEATRALITQNRIADLEYQLNQANTAIANAVQTQNILNNLGAFYTKPSVNPYTAYGNYGCGCNNI